jgi:hypothetical protein
VQDRLRDILPKPPLHASNKKPAAIAHKFQLLLAGYSKSNAFNLTLSRTVEKDLLA